MQPVPSRRVALVYAGHGIIHGYAFVFPTLMLLIKQEFGVSWVAVGIVTTLSNLSLGLGSIPAGLAVDRFGPRPALALAMLWCGLSSVVAALAPTLGVLAVSSVFFGLGLSLFHPGAMVYVTTARPGSGRALAWYGIGGGVGTAGAPLVLAGCAALTSWRGAFWLLFVVGLAAAAAFAWLLPPAAARAQMRGVDAAGGQTPPPKEALRPRLAGLAMVFSVSLATGFVFAGFVTYLPSYLAQEAPPAFVGSVAGGALATLVLVWGMMGQWGGGRFSESSRPARMYLVVVVAGGLALALMGLLSGWGVVVAAAVYSAAYFAGEPIGASLLVRFAPARRRGVVFGVHLGLAAAMGAAAGGLMGLVADAHGLHAVYVVLGVCTVPAVVAAVILAARVAPVVSTRVALAGGPNASVRADLERS